MKKLLFILTIALCSYKGFTQAELIVKSNDKGLHLTHTVSPKESFYSISRLYNIAPKDLAAYNGIDMAKGLEIGQTIQVPLTTNFSQTTAGGTPVYYVVGEGEGLYRVSVKNGNVLMASLRSWNNLSSDALIPGQKLVVGFIQKDATAASTAPVLQEPKAEAAQQKKPEPVTIRTAEPEKKIVTAPSTLKDGKGGYFKQQFEHQARTVAVGKDQTANAGIFKTASGWEDAKYYALMDGVEPGTIVRVINPSNSKAIYAKVLGAMTGISQNKGLDVRISSAAANMLEVADTEKFIVRVNY